MEYAKHNGKELHISNNDCTQAYDATPFWGMQLIYKYHKFPPKLVALLNAMDTEQRGTLLTAYGPGDLFTKRCGLGQGSILSPLRWNLFVDPLMTHLSTVGTPYIIGTGPNKVDLHAIAFADDMAIVAPDHASYVQRMKAANTYLSYFGVEFNLQKTVYTHNSETPYQPARLWDRKTDRLTPTASAPATTPLRYLGGMLPLSLDWETPTAMLMGTIMKPLHALNHKALQFGEYKYIIQMVISAKLRYYLNVIPLTKSHKHQLDTHIRTRTKQLLKLPKSTPSEILYLPAKSGGYGIQNIELEERKLLISQAQRILNNKYTLGKIARTSILSIQQACHLTTNPLEYPDLIKDHPGKFWFSRVATALHDADMKIMDPMGKFTIRGNRAKDHGLHTILTTHQYLKLRTSLRKLRWTWISDIASLSGINFKSRKVPHQLEDDAKKLQSILCHPNSNRLIYTVSPLKIRQTNPFANFKTTTHKSNIVVALPEETLPGVFAAESLTNFYVTGTSTWNTQGQEITECFPLIQHKGTPCNVAQQRDGPWHNILKT